MVRPGVFLIALMFTGAALAQPAGETARGWEQLNPAQRTEVWGRMDPDQRERAWRRLPPEERAAIRERMSPQEREQMRNRYLERRAQGVPPGYSSFDRGPGPGPGSAPREAAPGSRGEGAGAPRRLSPDERRQLREQIREANRDLPPHPRHEGRGR